MKLVLLLGLTMALARDGGGSPTPPTTTFAEETSTANSTDAPCTFPSCLQFSKPVCARNSRGDVMFFYNYCDLLVRNCRDNDDYEPADNYDSCTSSQ